MSGAEEGCACAPAAAGLTVQGCWGPQPFEELTSKLYFLSPKRLKAMSQSSARSQGARPLPGAFPRVVWRGAPRGRRGKGDPAVPPGVLRTRDALPRRGKAVQRSRSFYTCLGVGAHHPGLPWERRVVHSLFHSIFGLFPPKF